MAARALASCSLRQSQLSAPLAARGHARRVPLVRLICDVTMRSITSHFRRRERTRARAPDLDAHNAPDSRSTRLDWISRVASCLPRWNQCCRYESLQWHCVCLCKFEQRPANRVCWQKARSDESRRAHARAHADLLSRERNMAATNTMHTNAHVSRTHARTHTQNKSVGSAQSYTFYSAAGAQQRYLLAQQT